MREPECWVIAEVVLSVLQADQRNGEYLLTQYVSAAEARALLNSPRVPAESVSLLAEIGRTRRLALAILQTLVS
ncbi:hypothetical protein [Kitasatospora purpeofusca]|uniref:hypothetical protein n=1 Tax=Kitasatospora purpeofusca TaxID=67352 RepID=UPI003868262F|nr:hypothetical protein OIP63_06035 [Kitasatospora purpeofusca]